MMLIDHPGGTVPQRQGLETGAAAGGTDPCDGGLRRPIVRAFEAPVPVVPVKVPPLPKPKRREPRFWQCEFCDRVSVDPERLCDPVPMQ